MPEITRTENGLTGTIIVAEQKKRRIHIIGRFGEEGTELKPYEAFLVVGEEWTDGYEFEVEHELEDVDDESPDAMTKDDWDTEISNLVSSILWGKDQSYEKKITDEHRALVAHL